ncbi:MAG: hypothetical protein NT167_24405 [Verrucomicrobia bacterium]|nr:hypothetical protein [Verrucomicrobiota bacterium]
MSGTAKQIFLANRLPGFTGRGDRYLGEIAQELRRVLWKTQSRFTFPACRLPEAACSEVAVLLVEWAEDIHRGPQRPVGHPDQGRFRLPALHRMVGVGSDRRIGRNSGFAGSGQVHAAVVV